MAKVRISENNTKQIILFLILLSNESTFDRKVTEARGTALKDVMATLPKGVYIVRCGDKSLTVTR